MKIIYLLNHSYIGNWPHQDKLHRVDTLNRRFALRMREYTDRYSIECWKPERMIRESITVHEDRITYRIFPASKSSFPYKHFSPSMLKAVREECRKGDCLLYIHGVHGKWINLIPLLVKDVPIVAQHHGEDVTYTLNNFISKPWRIILAILERQALKNVDHFFMLYSGAKDKLSRYVPEERISIQTSGVDFDLFQPMGREEAKHALGLNPRKRYLLSIGMLENRKGTDLLLRALPPVFNKYPDIELLLIGTSARKEYEKMLLEITLQSGITERVKFLGQIENEKLPLYYNASDLFILPSIKAEGVPKVLMEAAACNLPFITTPIGGIRELAHEIGGGILIEPGSPEKIGLAIDGYFSHPPATLNLREKAKKHSWDTIVRASKEVFERLEEHYYSKPCSGTSSRHP
jgi:glycosyltransferase involved in cell wall biosynthesis